MTQRILIVDDERHIGTLLAHTLDDLQDADVELVVVDDPHTAVLRAQDKPPDLAFIDLDMPGFSGTQLCKVLRELFPDRTLPLVLLVEKGHQPPADLCSSLGVECIDKPFDPDRVRALACAALGFEFDG